MEHLTTYQQRKARSQALVDLKRRSQLNSAQDKFDQALSRLKSAQPESIPRYWPRDDPFASHSKFYYYTELNYQLRHFFN